MLRRLFFITIVGLAYSFIAKAQPYCDVRSFTVEDGLAANAITDLEQAPDHIMWFGTYNGLCYYDGSRFSTFYDGVDSHNNAEDILTTNRIYFLKSNVNSDVYFSTYDKEFYVFSTHTSQFYNISKYIKDKFNLEFKADNVWSFPDSCTWVSDDNHQIVLRIDDRNMDFENPDLEVFSEVKGNLKGTKLLKVELDNEGREWVFTDKSIFIYNSDFKCNDPYNELESVGKIVYLASKNGKLAWYSKGMKNPRRINLPKSVTAINQILALDDKTLLVATNDGILFIDTKTNAIKQLSVQNPNMPTNNVVKIFAPDANCIWAFTDGSGVTFIDANTLNTKWLTANISDPLLRTTSTHPFILKDEHGTVWVVPNDGTFSYFDPKEMELVPYPLVTYSYNQPRYIHNIFKYTINDQSILWITSKFNLLQVNFKYHAFYLGTYVKGTQMTAINQKDIDHWWGGYSDGTVTILDVNHRNLQGSKLRYLNRSGQIQDTPCKFSNNNVQTLYTDSKGRFWIGTRDEGLFVLQNGTLIHFEHDPYDINSLSSNNVESIECDDKGNIWIGTYGGAFNLIKEDEGKIKFLNYNNYFTNFLRNQYDRINNISIYKDEIRLCTTDGLVVFSNKFKNPRDIKYYKSYHIMNDNNTLMASNVINVYTSSKGITYIAELGGTLEYHKGSTLLKDNIKVEAIRDLNPNGGTSQSVIEDKNGMIWIIRESTLNKLDPNTGKIEVYGPNDFDANLNFTDAKPIIDMRRNIIALGSRDGVFAFTPEKFKQTKYIPKIVYTYAYHPGDEKSISILHTKELEVPSDKRNISINFSSLDYSRNYQMQYAYKLDDGKWTSLGTSHIVAFNNLPAGHHTLKVKSTNTHGVWAGDNTTILKIYAKPTFRESILGRLFFAAIILALFIFALKLYNNRQKERMNQQIVEAKNTFYSDISHQIRTPLALIGGPVQEVLREENLSKKSRILMQMVEHNYLNMITLVNKMLRYDNENFTTGEGSPVEEFEKRNNMQLSGISDENADKFLQDVQETEAEEEIQEGQKDTTILIVEDNPELRAFLYSILHHEYNILQAENGSVGLKVAKNNMPDFILTDITMPVMDGLTMIHEIKKDSNIAHIPIIILSARSSKEDQELGLSEGVYSYITKPFSATYLKGRIHNILANQRLIQQNLLKKIENREGINITIPAEKEANNYPNELTIVTEQENNSVEIAVEPAKEEEIEDPIIKSIIEYVEANIDDADMKIDDIAMNANLSRSALYSKVKTAVGMTPVDFVRNIRIIHAQKLIATTNEPLSQIAYMAGFSDSKYFSKVFKREVGMTPSEYREQNSQENKNGK